MSYLIFDIETNGLLDELDTIHCLVIADSQTGKLHAYKGQAIKKGLMMLSDGIRNGTKLCGHDIIRFDCPAIKKLYGISFPTKLLVDTLILSKLMYPDMIELDTPLVSKQNLPKRLWGSHLSLIHI